MGFKPLWLKGRGAGPLTPVMLNPLPRAGIPMLAD